MKRVLTLFFTVFFLSTSWCMAQEWDNTKVKDLHQWTFRMSQGADSLGYTTWEIRRIGDQILLSEDSNVPSFSEDIFCYLNGQTLEPDSVLVTGRLSGFPIECKAKWQGNDIRGYAHFPKHPSRPMISLNQTVPNDTKVRLASFVLSPFYKNLELGSSFSYPQFSTTDGQLTTIQAKVTAEETVMVLGQKVKALKLELSGGAAEQNIYIDTKRNRIVKITFRNIDWVYELISD